jgi:hypothetical protein
MVNANGYDVLANDGALWSYTGLDRKAPPGRLVPSSRDFFARRTTTITITSSIKTITMTMMGIVAPPTALSPPDDASVCVGEAVGAAVGEVGVAVGDAVGVTVGTAEGAAVGDVGFAVGADVGADVGTAEGALVGDAVGVAVGAVGEVVGAAVGESVATHVCALQAEHPENRWNPGKHSQVKVFPCSWPQYVDAVLQLWVPPVQGCRVGGTVGVAVGANVGALVGANVGARVGGNVGARVVGVRVGENVGAYDAHANESTPYPHVPVPYLPDCAHAAGLEGSAPHAVHDSDVPLQDAPVWPLLHGDHTHEKVVPDNVVEPVVVPAVILLLPTVVVKAGIVNVVQPTMVSSLFTES